MIDSAGDWSALAGGMASVGAVVGFYVRKITGPRFATIEATLVALQSQAADATSQLADLAKRIEAVDDNADNRSANVREVMGGKDKEIHDRIDKLKETVGTMRDQIGYLRGKTTRRSED